MKIKHVVIEVLGERAVCKHKEKLEIRIELIDCHCLNGGECIRGANHLPMCVCPPAYTGNYSSVFGHKITL